MIGGVGDDGKTSVTVAARDKLTVVHVVEVGDVAAWEVEVEDHSIELSVTLKVSACVSHPIWALAR